MNLQSVKYVKSKRGKTLISIDGYTFCAQSVIGMKTRWICSTHNNKRCRASLHTFDNEIVKMKNDHNH
ncbi:hypothetical protein O3G_MSEX001971 [Manduca sexta]|uniref:FLYWCH-type domain-containing protein n=1 Tax=Manduca sexta TaxID=7130 RepID=A0A922CCD6_MANSE|nr:hypothetical protein O3G_MSEX001971 [Manduca sexta]